MRLSLGLWTRLILVCGVVLGTSGFGAVLAECSKSSCHVACAMHEEPAPEPEPLTCCDKKELGEVKPKPEPKECQCFKPIEKTTSAAALAQAPPLLLDFSVPEVAVLVELGEPYIESGSVRVPRCLGPPGGGERSPALGRAPPVR